MDKINDKPILTAEHFYKFFQCPHWIWYDLYGDPAHKKEEASPLLQLIYKGKVSESEELLKKHRQFETIEQDMYKDLEEAFLATLEMMKAGKNIYHGALMDGHWVGMPDFLEARPGKSKLGEHYYVVYDIQNSLELRDDLKFQLIFYSLILEKIQGVMPKEAYVIDLEGNERSFLVEEYLDYFHLTKDKIEKILDGEKPAPFLKSGCKRTPWYSLCMSDAKDCGDVSLIYRISQADQRRLYEVGLKTVEDLAKANPDELQSLLEEWQYDKIIRFVNQAQSLVDQKPLVLRKPMFPEVETEVYFDIESDPTRDISYLFGMLVRNTKTGETKYVNYFADDKEGEKEVWDKFLKFIDGLDDFVIYHYAFYEKMVFEKLANRYGAPYEVANKFKEQSIDLHNKLVDSVILPLYFYNLKDVARYFGFEWDDPDAGGAESVAWYNDFQKKGDKDIKKKIIRYNEDDVRATMLIKDWLSEHGPQKLKETLDAE